MTAGKHWEEKGSEMAEMEQGERGKQEDPWLLGSGHCPPEASGAGETLELPHGS